MHRLLSTYSKHEDIVRDDKNLLRFEFHQIRIKKQRQLALVIVRHEFHCVNAGYSGQKMYF